MVFAHFAVKQKNSIEALDDGLSDVLLISKYLPSCSICIKKSMQCKNRFFNMFGFMVNNLFKN